MFPQPEIKAVDRALPAQVAHQGAAAAGETVTALPDKKIGPVHVAVAIGIAMQSQ
jgi:hypothetical protein